MKHSKFNVFRIISMSFGSILNIGFIVCCILLIFNSTNANLRQVLIPIVITYSIVIVLFCLFFGRIFCGFLCPLGFFEDILWRITERLHLPKLPRDSKFMKLIDIFNKFFLIVFILAIIALIVLAFFPDILSKFSIPMFVIFVVPIIMISFNLLARRFFCNVCPLGSFIGLFYKVNIVKLKKNPESCTFCGACYETCPMRIKNVLLENKKENISNTSCIFCGECIRRCPKDDALSILLLNKTLYKSSNKDFLKFQFDEVNVRKSKNNGK